MEIIYLFSGLLVGAAFGYLLLRNKFSGKLADLQAMNATLNQKTLDLLAEKKDGDQLKMQQQNEITTLTSELAVSRSMMENLKVKLTEQKADLENLQQRLTTEFENLANRILEEKGKTLGEQHQKNLDGLLKPFQEKIKDFERKVEEAYDKELRDKISLREEVRKLYDLNAKLSIEATNLTRALKGDSKKQGNWGELMLEKILESSGLKKGMEYRTQVVTENLEGRTIKPDVLILLPDHKHLVIDAKVSLTAYDRYLFSEEETDKERSLRDHINSVRAHVKDLSEKNYHTALGIESPDFVLLFMPIESAFSLAIQNDGELFHFAWEKRIVIVSPTTLLATLRTVASLWKIESQNKNAMEIARLSGSLYDKLEGVIQDLIRLGNSIRSMDDQYKAAMNKMHEGQGNVIRTAEKIKALGAKATKSLPQSMIDRADE